MNKTLGDKIVKLERAGYKMKKNKKLYEAMQKFEDALKLWAQI